MFEAFKRGLSTTRDRCLSLLKFFGPHLDEVALGEIRSGLYAADFGPEVVEEIVGVVREMKDRDRGMERASNVIREILKNAVGHFPPDENPQTVVLVGINGGGKTTTAAKLAASLQKRGRRVILGSCDTFRAAANEQLRSWAERLQLDFVGSQARSDAASVAYDTCSAAIHRRCDAVILDTAGRLHTNINLMEEVKKLMRVVEKFTPPFRLHRWIVVDGSLGSNSLEQAKSFHEAVALTGIVVTKLDGTGRGGALVSIHQQLKIPIYFVGFGEGAEDLRPFSTDDYVEALFYPPKSQ
jgi:fused signal recognition particle receptor